MAGYNGYSMSNNAISAYEDGQKPLSKWTKKDIIDAVKEFRNDLDLSKLNSNELKKKCLVSNEWHHTSSKFNKTDFYEINKNFIEDLTQEKIDNIVKNRQETKPEKEKFEIKYAFVNIGVWQGTRRHPKLSWEKHQAIIYKGWAYFVDRGYTELPKKKNLDGNYVEVLKTFNRKPKEFDNAKTKAVKNELIKKY